MRMHDGQPGLELAAAGPCKFICPRKEVMSLLVAGLRCALSIAYHSPICPGRQVGHLQGPDHPAPLPRLAEVCACADLRDSSLLKRYAKQLWMEKPPG